MAPEPVIVDALRTPFAPAGRELADWDAAGLAATCIRALLARVGCEDARVDEVLLGCAGNPLDAANIARVAALRAGMPQTVPAMTMQRNCASGMDAIADAALRIESGRAEIVLAGGVEHMSGYPLVFRLSARERFLRLAKARTTWQRLRAIASLRPRHFKPVPALIVGLRDPSCGLSMGDTAEVLAREHSISREAQDAFALGSHERAAAASVASVLSAEIVPVFPPPRHDRALADDSGIREGQTLEKLARLKPVFDRAHGTVTAGNACQITDGAALCLVTKRELAEREGWPVLGRIAGRATVGLDPRRMGLGPVYAAPVALAEAGIGLADCDVIELNEAFAAQVLACIELLEGQHGAIDRARLNPHGGAIARGHPLGATGARLVGAVLHELQRTGKRWGLATLCVGGGQGAAMVLEGGS